MAQPDMLTGKVTRCRGEVVSGDRGQTQFPPPLGLQRTSAGGVDLEPQDGCAQQPALPQIVANPRLHGAQILADHHRAGPMRLQCHDPDHRVVVVPHVRALGGRGTLGNPPQPEQPDDVVDANPAGVPQNRLDQRSEGLVAKLFELIGSPWRLGPVLAQLVELIGRGAGGHPQCQNVLQRPAVRASRMHPDGEIGHDAERHPGANRLSLGVGQLLIKLPLQPAVEIHHAGMLFGEAGNRGTVWVLQLRGPLPPVAAMLFG